MSASTASLYQYSIPLLSLLPRQVEQELVAQGYILELKSPDGFRGFGEITKASLLPHESFGEIEKQISLTVLGEGQPSIECYPPVLWGVSSACFGGFGKGSDANTDITLNCLLDASQENFVDEALAFHAQGYRVFKIKVGDAPLAQEISKIREFASIAGTNVSIRLDGNQRLALSHAVEFAQALRKIRIEYFEEPFLDMNDVESFHSLTGMSVALDETLLNKSEFQKWGAHEAVSAYVIKPSRIGAVSKVLSVIESAVQFEKKFVFSSTYESGVGISVLALFAMSRQKIDVAMGLGTGSFFASDILTPPIRSFRGKIIGANLKQNLQRVDLRKSSFCNPLFEDEVLCERGLFF